MKISLFQGVLIGTFILAALIGLFVFATYTNTGGAGSVGTVTLWGTLPLADMQAGLIASSRSDTSLKGVTYVQKNSVTLPADLAAAIATGAPPDLVLASQEELVALAPFIAPVPSSTLSARTFADTFAGGAEVFAAPGGGFYGVPVLIDPLVLFYNRPVLSSEGIATPPTSWEALTGLVPHVVRTTETRQITRGLIDLGTYANVHDARGILSTLFLQTSVPITTRGPNGLFSADLGLNSAAGGVPPGQAVVRFYTQFADPSKVSYTWNASLPDSLLAFQTGDVALHLGYVSEARFLTSANPNLDFDVAPVPQPATAPVKSTYGLIYALMIPHSAKNPSGAYSAAALLAGAGEQLALANATGLAPASRSALSAVQADPIAATAASSALYTKGWLSPAPADTDSVFSAMIGSVISGRSTLDAALGFAERSLGALLQH